jgi:O-antigen/teichoic acid export membrane protein
LSIGLFLAQKSILQSLLNSLQNFWKEAGNNYRHYFISILLPALLGFLSIPLQKKLMGDANFGEFNILFSALLIINVISTATICQSILRHNNLFQQPKQYFLPLLKRILLVAFLLSALFVAIVAWRFSLSQTEPLLLFALLPLCACYTYCITVCQACFFAKTVAIGEALRTIILFAILLTWHFWHGHITISELLAAYLLSYGIGILALLLLHKQSFFNNADHFPKQQSLDHRVFFSYGFPIAIWYCFIYLMLFVEKALLSHLQFSPSLVGNYAAVYDIINKSVSMLFLPVLAIYTPTLSAQFEQGEKHKVSASIRNLLLIECFVAIVLLLGYWLIGHQWLTQLLQWKQPQHFALPISTGLVILLAAMAWQIAMIWHKPLEMHKQTQQMALAAAISFLLSTPVNYWCLKHFGQPALGYSLLLSPIIYVLTTYWLMRQKKIPTP